MPFDERRMKGQPAGLQRLFIHDIQHIPHVNHGNLRVMVTMVDIAAQGVRLMILKHLKTAVIAQCAARIGFALVLCHGLKHEVLCAGRAVLWRELQYPCQLPAPIRQFVVKAEFPDSPVGDSQAIPFFRCLQDFLQYSQSDPGWAFSPAKVSES
jgi:hypothetical protein